MGQMKDVSPIVEPVWLVAVTGHRPKVGIPGRSVAELEATGPLLAEALKSFSVQAAGAEGVIHLLSSAAAGIDVIACETAANLGIPIHLILPLPEEEFSRDFTDVPGDSWWPRSQAIINACKTGENGNTFRLASSTHQHPQAGVENGPDCYADTNFQMLAWADALIAVTTDSASMTDGGSASFLKDAIAQKLPWIQINPETCVIVRSTNIDALTDPANHRSGLQLLETLGHYLVHSPEVSPASDCPLNIAAKLFDEAANYYSKRTRNNLLAAIWLHGSASFLAAIGLAYALADGPHYKYVLLGLVMLEVVLIATAEILHRQSHKRHHGPAWLDCRFAAEKLRMLQSTKDLLDPLESVVDRHRPSWRRFVLSFALNQSKTRDSLNFVQSKAAYLKNRIENQQEHYDRKAKEAIPKSQRAYFLMRASSLAALGVVIIAVGFKWYSIISEETAHHFGWLGFSKDFLLYLLPVALPLLAGILLAIRQSFDLSRRQHRYQQMVELLEAAKDDLAAARTPHALRLVVMQVEETLLDERIEFDIAQRIGLEH